MMEQPTIDDWIVSARAWQHEAMILKMSFESAHNDLVQSAKERRLLEADNKILLRFIKFIAKNENENYPIGLVGRAKRDLKRLYCSPDETDK